MKFPANSLIAGNSASETSSLETASSSGESGANSIYGWRPPERPQPREGPLLVSTHEPAIPGHVSGKNSGQPAFGAFRGQSGASQPHGPNRLSGRGLCDGWGVASD